MHRRSMQRTTLDERRDKHRDEHGNTHIGKRLDRPAVIGPEPTGRRSTRIPHNPRTVRATAVGLLTLAVVAAGVLPGAGATASPIGDKQQQAAQLEAQIQTLQDKSGALDEQANAARYHLTQIQPQITKAQAQTAAAETQVRNIKNRLSDRAATLYANAGASTPLAAIDVQNVQDLASRSTYADAAAQEDRSLITQFKNAQDDLAAQQAQLEQAQSDAQAQEQAARQAAAQSRQVGAQLQAALSQVNGEIAVLIRQEQERQAAVQRAALLAKIQAAQAAQARAASAVTAGGRTSGRSSGSNVTFPSNLPAPSGNVAAVIAYARAQLGKPYVYATSGPNSFDCSGLTAAAWAQAGVQMAHYSGAQYDEFPHVPLSALQPGDLVFYGPGGSQHVQLYIGGGMVIEAPHTGDVVKIATVRPSAIGAARP